MKMELHAHTFYSRRLKITYDGVHSPEQMISAAKKLGLGAIAIVDHDTVMAHKLAEKSAKKHGIIFIPGEEISTKGGHLVGLGIQEVIRPGLPVLETIDMIHDQGGIAVSVHPFDIRNDGIREQARYCDAIEIFNAINVDRIANRKAENFAKSVNKPVVAGSDAHHTDMIGRSITITSADSVESILRNIRKGRTQIETRYHDIPTMLKWITAKLDMSYDDIMDYMNENYFYPKKYMLTKLLHIALNHNRKSKIFVRGLSYFSLGMTILHYGTKEIVGLAHVR